MPTFANPFRDAAILTVLSVLPMAPAVWAGEESGMKTRPEAPALKITMGNPAVIQPSDGDTWEAAWADDGHLYVTSDDTKGFHGKAQSNLAYHRLCGGAGTLTGETVNAMQEYGEVGALGPDQCCWKACGNTCVDGTLYVWVSRHNYGERSGDPTRRQTAANASLIKSTDHGKTWTRTAKENYDRPMFPGRRFGAPFFIKYGQDYRGGADGAERFVYAVSNNGFWDNGDDMILGRVPRGKIGGLNAADWQFFKGGDGSADAAWTSKLEEAAPIIRNPGKCSMTGAQYLSSQKRYLLVQWYYPCGGGKNGNNRETVWDFYFSPSPWGPWKAEASWTNSQHGYYNPCVVGKFVRNEARDLVIFTAGRWDDAAVYKLTLLPCSLTVLAGVLTTMGAEQAAPGGEWKKLFADERWYKDQTGDEKVFSGKLEAVGHPGGPTTLMRSALYKLGDRAIYTGAKKVAALDELVGKNVEVRGKTVDMALEGQQVREIWPASVRAAFR